MKFLKYKLFLILTFSFFVTNESKTQSVEYYIKASFIEKFARFTEWEPNSISDNFIIGVIGKNPFQKELEQLSQKAKIKNRKIIIYNYSNYKDIEECNLIFISSSERKELTHIIAATKNKNILLVSDSPGFAEKGVHFNFYFKPDATLHFEINIEALKESNLKTDIQLINIGKVIKK